MLSRELQNTISLASLDAQKRRHEFVTLEHVLLAMTREKTAAEVLTACGADPGYLARQLESYLDQNVERIPEGFSPEEEEFGGEEGLADLKPQITGAFERVLERAAMQAFSAQRSSIDSGAVLAAMFYERRSHAVYLLEQEGVSRLDVLNFISHGVGKYGAGSARDGVGTDGIDIDAGGLTEPGAEKRKVSALEEFCVDLLEQAKANRIDPLIGREAEVARTVQVLCRRRKNNPVYVGEPGVGKTAIAEGLALKIARGEVPKALKASHVYALDMGALVAGARYRGDFEDRLKAVIKELKNLPGSIVFIDEIHTIVRAGAVEGGAMDASNILKPALASGELRCIGSTTHNEYKASFEKDKGLARRFQKIDVLEPSISDTIKILQGLKPHYENYHGVHYPDVTLEAAAELSSRHINDRFLPDKAVDVMDEAGALVKLKVEAEQAEVAPDSTDKAEVTPQDVELTVASMAKIPPRTVSGSDKDRLQNLEKELKQVIFGQDHAIETMVKALKLSRAGLGHPDKPIGSFLCSGPTGVGKTELAKQLARIMGVNFLRFDMSEYMEKHTVSRLIGAPPGYVGFDQGGLLTDAVGKTPHCVVLMDEIEKAHPEVFNILLQVMDHGSLTDNNGKKADFRNVILIMSTNAGARDMMGDTIGFQAASGKGSLSEHLAQEAEKAKREREQDKSASSSSGSYGFGLGKGRGAIERTFSPEFRNRLDAWIPFNPLTFANILLVVDKFVGEVKERLLERSVQITVTPAAREWLAEHGYDRMYGARPMARLIKEKVSEPLAEEVLFGKLEHGGSVLVDVEPAEGGAAEKLKLDLREALAKPETTAE
ncbi:MAG TPA: AAA family ATPase [Candidatus Obscuribacter sp.]|nr:AAA family ATPase [Candidatus Obscuribacter sp.]